MSVLYFFDLLNDISSINQSAKIEKYSIRRDTYYIARFSSSANCFTERLIFSCVRAEGCAAICFGRTLSYKQAAAWASDTISVVSAVSIKKILFLSLQNRLNNNIMSRTHFMALRCRIFLLAWCLVLGMQVFAQETVTLVFTGTDPQGTYVQLGSVEIRNLTRNWSETIVFPDTVYTLAVGTSIPENPQKHKMQVMPNPFDGHTRVNIFSEETESVSMTLTDINGRRHAEYAGTLQSGDNFFEISLTMPQTYILTVRTATGVRSLKMVNTGHGGTNRIEATETSPRPAEVRLRSTSSHDFQLGDQMEYVGHATLHGTPMTSSTVTQAQFNNEDITLLFDPAAPIGIFVTTDSILFGDNGIYYGYGTVLSSIPVTARGFCWSTERYPTIDDIRTDEGAGTGSFTSTIAGFDPTLTYYARAYAITTEGVVYGVVYVIKQSCNFINSEVKFIPDGLDCGEGCVLTSTIIVSNLPPQSVIQSEEDIRYVRVKLEHSYVGDLWIALQCPNGNIASLLRKYASGGGANTCASVIPSSEWGWIGTGNTSRDFGIKGENDNTSDKCDTATNPMGTPWNYVWSNNTSLGYVYSPDLYVYSNSNVITSNSQEILDSTDVANMTNVFRPDNSFSNLEGCPINGAWNLQIVDGWGIDNGWLAEWEIAFHSPGEIYPADTVVSATPCPQADSATDYDGNVYSTVAIGEQCWLRENMRATHTTTGVPLVQGDGIDAETPLYYLPNLTDGDNIDYGYLYNWEAAKNVCPAGWRLPTDAEWTQLTDFLGEIDSLTCGGNPANIAKAMAAQEGWDVAYTSCAVGADMLLNNKSGFSALPAGNAYEISTDAGSNALFWTATPHNDNFVYYRALQYNQSYVERNSYGNKASGMSVRCILDLNTSRPSVTTTNVSGITNTTATCGGNVVDEGNAPVTERGVCWSTTATPTVDDEHTTDVGGTGSFVATLTSLTPRTTYFARAYATNAFGTSYGPQITFTTKDLPKVDTRTLSSDIFIDIDVPILCGGTVISDGGDSVTARGVCWCTYPGTPTINDSHTVDGSGTGTFTSSITGLSHGTGYRVRAYATNSFGTAYGSPLPFMTAGVPTVIMNPVTNVQSTTATCSGRMTQDNGAAQLERGICWDTLPNPTIAGNHSAASTTGVGDYTITLTNLTPGTTYYARAYATNVIGTGYSNDVTFTTLTIPTVTTNTVTNITFHSAMGGGEVLNTGVPAITERGICWSTSQNPTIAGSHCADSLAAGSNGFGTFTTQLSDLALNTTYYVRAYATNSSGTGYGDQVSFQTLALPSITTGTVTSIIDTTANCSGLVTSDGGDSVTARGICWSTSANPTLADNHTVDSCGLGSFIGTMTGLIPGTQYHVRAYATNGGGTAYGGNRTFTTKTTPTVSIDSVVNITSVTARCTCHVTHNGGLPLTARGLCWDTIPSPTINGNHTTNGTSTGNFIVQITDLTPGVTYYVRCYATNSIGISYSNEYSFTTLTTPILTTADISDIDFHSATGGGEILNLNIPAITARGVCWSTSQNPTLADNYSIDSIPADSNGFGTFTTQLTDLATGTRYYVRAYATNSSGTNYGEQVSFWTLSLPTFYTSHVDGFSDTLAQFSGSISSIGGGPIIARGFCWDTVASPTIEGNHTVDSSSAGTGSFTATVTGLTPGTQYYMRPYATNGGGTAYGQQRVFTTHTVPSVVLDTTLTFTNESAFCTGHVTHTGGTSLSVIEWGVCWDTLPNPTVADNVVDGDDMSAHNYSGNFTVQLTPLVSGKTYYVRAYARNLIGTAYSNEVVFTFDTVFNCGVSMVTDYDGNAYNTMLIDNQCWMAENLRSTSYSPNLSNAPTLSHPTTYNYSACFTNAYYYYPGNNPDYVSTYGLLYNWRAAMGGASSSNDSPSGVQGICPDGWHIPSQNEFTTFMQQSNYTSVLGSDRPGEYFAGNNSYSSLGTWIHLWSSTAHDTVAACCLSYNGTSPSLSILEDKGNGFSVRCLRNY